MRALLAFSLLASSLAGCAMEAVDHGDSEVETSEVAGALSAYGKNLTGTFATTDMGSDFDQIVLKSNGTYETSETIYCITTPCEPLKDSGRFIGYKPKGSGLVGGLRLTSKSGKSTYYRVGMGAPHESFKLSRDGKAWFRYDAVSKCNYADPTKRYIGKSLEQCMVIRYACSAGETGFSNECGCGCEVAAPVPSCVVTGCSGQLCAESDMMTTCEYRAEYACYAKATCERDAAGKCGWRATSELSSCLSSAGTF